jgi:hypothetical protein
MHEKVHHTKVTFQYEDTIYPVTHLTLAGEEAKELLERLKREVRLRRGPYSVNINN